MNEFGKWINSQGTMQLRCKWSWDHLKFSAAPAFRSLTNPITMQRGQDMLFDVNVRKAGTPESRKNLDGVDSSITYM